MNRIDSLFARLRRESRPALMPFVTAGDPDLATTAGVILEIIRRGADMVEVGIPYSDPIADGPVIAASYARALRGGVRLSHIFDTFRTLRAEAIDGPTAATPLVAMISFAIIHRQGSERFLREAVRAGFDGLIVPDLPVEESEGLVAPPAATPVRPEGIADHSRNPAPVVNIPGPGSGAPDAPPLATPEVPGRVPKFPLASALRPRAGRSAPL